MEIKKAAKEGNKEACTLLAKQLIQVRKQKNRTYAANSKISSVGFQNKSMGANIALSNAMGTTSKTMGEMNKIMRPDKIAGDMRAFQQANMKMEMTDEMSMLSVRSINKSFHQCHGSDRPLTNFFSIPFPISVNETLGMCSVYVCGLLTVPIYDMYFIYRYKFLRKFFLFNHVH